MTTNDAADFYVGRGAEAEFIGSVLTDGDPLDIDALDVFLSCAEFEFTETEFRDAVGDLSGIHCDWLRTATSSVNTPWTYMYSAGSVYVYRFGVEMIVIRTNYMRTVPRKDRSEDGESFTVFPNETERRPRQQSDNQFPTMTRKATADVH
jgi:hypothetical protein